MAKQHKGDFQIDCLAVISGIETRKETPYGLAIKRGLEDMPEREYGEVNPAQLYPNLDALVNDGCIEKSELDGRTNAYQLANKGMDVLRTRIGGLQDTMDGKQPEVLEA